MRPQHHYISIDDNAIVDAINNFSDWYFTFAKMLEERAFTELFNNILHLLYQFDGEPVTRMTDTEIEEQTILCSQHRETVIHLARETAFHFRKMKRSFNIWLAEKSDICKDKILEKQANEIKENLRTKGSYGLVTKDDIKNKVLIDYKVEYLRWKTELDKIEKTNQFLIDTADDMKDRSISLQSVAKNRNTY